LHSCAEVHELIKLSFGVVSGVDPGIDVLDVVHKPQGEGAVAGVVCPHWPSGFNGAFSNRNVLDSCVRS